MAYDIDSWLVAESGRIGPDIHAKVFNSSPWLKLIRQKEWMDEYGSEISVLTYERTLPSSALTWSTVGFNTGDTSSPGANPNSDEGTCLPPNQTLTFAQTTRTYNLQHTSLNGPPLCVNDLRFPFKRQTQLSMMLDMLAANTSYAWNDRYRNEYIRSCQHKVCAMAGLPENTGLTLDPNVTTPNIFPAQQPTSYLTQGILDRIYMKLIRDGAGINPLGRQNGRPQFGLICSSETSDRVIKDINASTGSAGLIQTQFLYAKPNELLAPLGVETAYRGYYHMVDDLMPRYNWNGSGWTRVQPYAGTAATYGTKQDISSAYENAQFEVSVVFHQDVYESLIPRPITSPGGDTRFDPVSYKGDFKWRNILDKTDNPDGTIGFHRAILSNGTKILRPEWGWAILHQRCGDMALTACPTS